MSDALYSQLAEDIRNALTKPDTSSSLYKQLSKLQILLLDPNNYILPNLASSLEKEFYRYGFQEYFTPQLIPISRSEILGLQLKKKVQLYMHLVDKLLGQRRQLIQD